MSSNTPFPKTGLVRLSTILAPAGPIPVSKSTWWEGVRTGRFPQPQKLGPRTTVWRAEDILDLVNRHSGHSKSRLEQSVVVSPQGSVSAKKSGE